MKGTKRVGDMLPNHRFQLTSTPPLRAGAAAAEAERWAAGESFHKIPTVRETARAAGKP